MPEVSVYLSGQFEDAATLRRVRDDLVRSGFRVTSRWLDGPSSTPATALAHEPNAGERLAAIGRQDIEDIEDADVVVVFNPPEACNVGRGGRHVETGYALARGKPIVIVGARGNVFHWLPEISVISGWSELPALLRRRAS